MKEQPRSDLMQGSGFGDQEKSVDAP